MTSPHHRRTRSDAAANLVRLAQAAGQELAPPAHVRLSDDAMPFWTSIVAEKAVADWSAHQLDLAAFLARIMASLEREHRMLREEGMIIPGPSGAPRVNPRNRIATQFQRQVLARQRSLHLTGRGTQRSEDATARRLANRAIERGLTDDDFLA